MLIIIIVFSVVDLYKYKIEPCAANLMKYITVEQIGLIFMRDIYESGEISFIKFHSDRFKVRVLY